MVSFWAVRASIRRWFSLVNPSTSLAVSMPVARPVKARPFVLDALTEDTTHLRGMGCEPGRPCVGGVLSNRCYRSAGAEFLRGAGVVSASRAA